MLTFSKSDESIIYSNYHRKVAPKSIPYVADTKPLGVPSSEYHMQHVMLRSLELYTTQSEEALWYYVKRLTI